MHAHISNSLGFLMTNWWLYRGYVRPSITHKIGWGKWGVRLFTKMKRQLYPWDIRGLWKEDGSCLWYKHAWPYVESRLEILVYEEVMLETRIYTHAYDMHDHALNHEKGYPWERNPCIEAWMHDYYLMMYDHPSKRMMNIVQGLH